MTKACYLHIPFCQEICAYCDFTRCRYHEGLADTYLLAIEKEIKDKIDATLSSIYIGGGTPSAVSIIQFEKLLKMIAPYQEQGCEFSIEANVESFTAEKIKLCKEYGVNRISLGVQTLQPKLLNVIQRHHQKEDVLAKIEEIIEIGISNISIDLIYGLPHQSLAMWKEDIQEIVQFPIQHISLYALTIEEHSRFGREGVTNIDPQIEADMYEYAITFLEENGFYQYEISNFSKKGRESQHNQVYWKYEDFYGIGCGASGKENHFRYDNTRNLETYLKKGPSSHDIELRKEDEMFEAIMMGLRLKTGVNYEHFYNQFQMDLCCVYKDVIEKQVEKGMLQQCVDSLCTTKKGMMLLHEVLIEFLPDNAIEA